MKPLRLLLLSSLLGCLSAAGNAAEGQPNAVEARLRQALKEANAQLGNVQAELTALQSSQTADSDEKKKLQTENEALKKKFDQEFVVTQKALEELKKKAGEEAAELARTKEALEAARKEAEKWLHQAQALDAKSNELDLDKTALLRKLADREEKNLKLFLLANEILTRYENFGLGKALAAKEPFVGSARTKLETLVQDYQDGIASLRVKH